MEITDSLLVAMMFSIILSIGADYRLRNGLSMSSTQDVIQFFSFVVLAFNKNLTLHKFITIFICVVVLSIVVAHGAGIDS